jgi:hypothetical protein
MKKTTGKNSRKTKLQPPVAIIAWTHNLVILQRCKDPLEREFYIPDARKPNGVATYRIVKRLPKALQGQLPTPEQIAILLEKV